VSGDPLDLDAWSSRHGETMGAAFERAKVERDALAAEVRRLCARSPITYPSDDALLAEVRRRGLVE